MNDKRHVLQQIFDAAGLGHDACAAALGLTRELLEEMLSGQREIPESMIPLVAAVVGISEAVLTAPATKGRTSDVVPAIWYKLRSDKLSDADREYVLALRQLAFYQHQLEELTNSQSVVWKTLFEALRRDNDPQSSPVDQGKQAARRFRRQTGLDQGATGIGEVFRNHIRNIGLVVIETSAPESILEGCSFYVGPSGAERPCILANSYRTTWFRRNRILMHELAHSIFDLDSTIAALDALEPDSSEADQLQEIRADAFAQEALVPPEVLRHMAQKNKIRWDNLSAPVLASLMAATHVEQRLLIKALQEAELVDAETANALKAFDLSDDLRRLTTHALSTKEYLRLAGAEYEWTIGRTTTTAPRKLLLPQRHVTGVVDAFRSHQISRGKAARMLMIDEEEFAERFADAQDTDVE